MEHFSIGLEVQTAYKDILHVIFLEVPKFLNLYVLSNTQLCKKNYSRRHYNFVFLGGGGLILKKMLNMSCIFNIFAVNTKIFMCIIELI